MTNRLSPYSVVEELEKRLADWCGSKYCVAVESASAGIFLSLQYMNKDRELDGTEIEIPSKTYPSIPCSIIHSRMKVKFVDEEWEGEYSLSPLNIWDAALRLRPNMYHGGFQVISGHIKKKLNIGRAGFILLDDEEAYQWLKRARFDGRNPIPLQEDVLTQLGFNMYLSPSDAARGIQLFEIYKERGEFNDLKVCDQKYSDLSIQPAYQ